MGSASLVIGIIVMAGAVVGLIPCVGWFNWVNLPIAGIGVIVSIIGIVTEPLDSRRNKAAGGLVLCLIAIIVGVFRLLIGGGVF